MDVSILYANLLNASSLLWNSECNILWKLAESAMHKALSGVFCADIRPKEGGNYGSGQSSIIIRFSDSVRYVEISMREKARWKQRRTRCQSLLSEFQLDSI